MKNILILIFLFVSSLVFSQNANTPTTGGGAADGTETIITGGTNVTVSGTGASGTPYVISSTGSGNVTKNTVAGQTPFTNPPVAPAEGDEFLNTTDNLSWIFDGTVWVPYPASLTYRIGKRVELITGLSGDSIRVVCDSLIASDNSFSISCDTLFIARNGRYWYVSNNGNNFDAEKGNISKPCRDVWAARDSAVAGDLIYVFKGVWNAGFTGEEATHGVTEFHKVYDATLNLESINLWKAGVDMYFDPGATINIYNENNIGRFICMPLFHCNTAGKMSIKGFGSFSMIGSVLKSAYRTEPTPQAGVINPGAGIFGAYFIWANHDEAQIDFTAEYINNKDILFENTKVDVFAANVKTLLQNGRDMLTVRGTGIRRSSIVLEVENVIMRFTDPVEIAYIGATVAPFPPIGAAGGMQIFIAGENKQIDVRVKNVNAEYGAKQLIRSGHSINNVINVDIGNFYAVDAVAKYTAGVRTLANDGLYQGACIGVRAGAANLTTSALIDSQFNVNIDNCVAPFAAMVVMAPSSARNSKVNVNVNNCRLPVGNAVRILTEAPNNLVTNSITDITISGNYICETNSCIHSPISGGSGIIPLEDMIRYKISGNYETYSTTLPAVQFLGPASGTMTVDGVSGVQTCGRPIFDNATFLTRFTESITAANAQQVITKSAYANKPVGVNLTSQVNPVTVNTLIK